MDVHFKAEIDRAITYCLPFGHPSYVKSSQDVSVIGMPQQCHFYPCEYIEQIVSEVWLCLLHYAQLVLILSEVLFLHFVCLFQVANSCFKMSLIWSKYLISFFFAHSLEKFPHFGYSLLSNFKKR